MRLADRAIRGLRQCRRLSRSPAACMYVAALGFLLLAALAADGGAADERHSARERMQHKPLVLTPALGVRG